MRFVAVKSEEQQALSLSFRTRDLLVRQKTQTINALRGHLAEFGIVAPYGTAQIERLQVDVNDLDIRIRTRARQDDQAKRFMTIPGIKPVCAAAIEAFTPPMEGFGSGRDFAAWMA
jgi:transposase